MPERNRKITVERKDVTLPIGLAAKVLAKLGGRGLSALVAHLLNKFLKDKELQKEWKESRK